MKQMNMAGFKIVAIDYESGALPSSVREFRPAVYMDEGAFCCILGPDPLEGVFGCGDSVQEALTDWDLQLQERARNPAENDKVAQYILDTFATENWVVW